MSEQGRFRRKPAWLVQDHFGIQGFLSDSKKHRCPSTLALNCFQKPGCYSASHSRCRIAHSECLLPCQPQHTQSLRPANHQRPQLSLKYQLDLLPLSVNQPLKAPHQGEKKMYLDFRPMSEETVMKSSVLLGLPTTVISSS